MASWVGSMFTLPAPLAWYPSGPSFHFMSMIQPLSGDNSVFGICFIIGGVRCGSSSSFRTSVEPRNAPANGANHPKKGRQQLFSNHSRDSCDSGVTELNQIIAVVGA